MIFLNTLAIGRPDAHEVGKLILLSHRPDIWRTGPITVVHNTSSSVLHNFQKLLSEIPMQVALNELGTVFSGRAFAAK